MSAVVSFHAQLRALPCAAFALWLLGAGCSAVDPSVELSEPSAVSTPARDNTPPEYRIAFGDELSIRFFYSPGLDEEVIVRPDGRISLPLVNEVVAAGRTPAELTQTLSERYEAELDDPEVTVIVRTFSEHRAYVTGAVKEPGEVILDSRLSVIDAIARTGDFTSTARRRQVLLVRRRPYEPEPVVMALDLRAVQRGAGLDHDVELQPFDLIHVPTTTIGDVNRWVEQYVRNVLPFDIGVRVDRILYD